jgi:hypothetical protein
MDVNEHEKISNITPRHKLSSFQEIASFITFKIFFHLTLAVDIIEH